MNREDTDKLKFNRKKLLLSFLLILLVLAIDCCISFATLPKPIQETIDLQPDLPASDQPSLSNDSETGKNQVNLTYTPLLQLSLSTGEVRLSFRYPEQSNQKIQLLLWIQDQLIATSDYLDPGVTVHQLSGADTSRLTVGEYQGNLQVLCFDEATLDQAVIQLQIPLSVIVGP